MHLNARKCHADAGFVCLCLLSCHLATSYTLTTVKQLVEWLFTLADSDQQIGMPAYARQHIHSAAAAAGSDVSSFSYDRVAWRNRTNSRASKPQHPLSVGPGGGSTRGGEGGSLPDEALVVGVDGVQG